MCTFPYGVNRVCVLYVLMYLEALLVALENQRVTMLHLQNVCHLQERTKVFQDFCHTDSGVLFCTVSLGSVF